MDCPVPATKIIKDLEVGLCLKHSNELLTSAILMKMLQVPKKKKK